MPMPGHEGHHMPEHDDAGNPCIMSMTWNSNTRDVCIITPAWHIRSSQGFVASLLVIFGVSVLYEYLKWVVRCLDVAIVRLEAAGASPYARSRREGEAETDGEAAAASLLRPRPTNARRLIPLTYADLVANDAEEDAPVTTKRSRPAPSALRLLYVFYLTQSLVDADADALARRALAAVRRAGLHCLLSDAGHDDL